MYITINPMTFECRRYNTPELALIDSVRLNKLDEDHPSFRLYHLMPDDIKFKYLGSLYRGFGTENYSFKGESDESDNYSVII